MSGSPRAGHVGAVTSTTPRDRARPDDPVDLTCGQKGAGRTAGRRLLSREAGSFVGVPDPQVWGYFVSRKTDPERWSCCTTGHPGSW